MTDHGQCSLLSGFSLAHLVHSADEDAVPEFAIPLLANEQDLVDKMRATIENAQNNALQSRNWEPKSLGVFELKLQAIVQVSSTVSLTAIFAVLHSSLLTVPACLSAHKALPASEAVY